MFPKNTELDAKTSCLTSLVGIRTACQPGASIPPFFIEDIDGLDLQKLAALTRPSSGSGQSFGSDIIASAAREMMGDIELLVTNGYRLNNIVDSQCSTCDLLPSYTLNSGILVRSVTTSPFQRLQITQITILTNFTGDATVVFDDGETTKNFPVQLQAGVKMPVKLLYETIKPQVKIYLSDPTIGLGRVSCPTASSCGCGGSSNSSPVVISGLVGGMENGVQYGFVPCASVGCSYDALICSMIQQTPNIFGMALLFKVGEKVTIIKSQHERKNEEASFTETNGTELTRNFGQLYWAKLQGGRDRRGIKNIVSDFLRTKKNDKCIVCENKFYTAGATG